MAVNQQDISNHINQSQIKTKHPGGRPSKYNPHILRKAKEYMKGEYKKIPTIAGLCVHLGVSRDTVYAWLKDETKTEFSDTLALMPEIREELLLDNALDGTWNGNTAKLILTTNHGYSENNQKDTAITVNVDRGRVSITSKDHAINVDTEKDITPIEHE